VAGSADSKHEELTRKRDLFLAKKHARDAQALAVARREHHVSL
jgi:hypothetical protein